MSKPTLADFKFVRMLGKGRLGKVLLVRSKTDGRVFAKKDMLKENIVRRNQISRVQAQRRVLENMNHPFIADLFFAFQTPTRLHTIHEYCAGGELFFHLSRAGRFSEDRTRFYAGEIMVALGYVHSHNVIYRNLLPENVLLSSVGHVKLSGFGVSKEGISDNVSATSMVGTPEYLAPEILNKKGHGRAVDWYTLGAITYEMLTGLPPYYSRDRQKLFARIRKGELRYPPYLQLPAREFMSKLLTADPSERLGSGPEDVNEVAADPFWSTLDLTALEAQKIDPPFKPAIDSPDDVRYFDKEFTRGRVNSDDIVQVPGAREVQRFEGFSFTVDSSKKMPQLLRLTAHIILLEINAAADESYTISCSDVGGAELMKPAIFHTQTNMAAIASVILAHLNLSDAEFVLPRGTKVLEAHRLMTLEDLLELDLKNCSS